MKPRAECLTGGPARWRRIPGVGRATSDTAQKNHRRIHRPVRSRSPLLLLRIRRRRAMRTPSRRARLRTRSVRAAPTSRPTTRLSGPRSVTRALLSPTVPWQPYRAPKPRDHRSLRRIQEHQEGKSHGGTVLDGESGRTATRSWAALEVVDRPGDNAGRKRSC